MNGQSTGPVLSAVFVDYDNIYLSLKRKSEEAAKRFAKEAHVWLREIESGRLITSTKGQSFSAPRRIVMNRCYGNNQPRRNPSDNSTDMNSFPFVRHHFMRAGFEVIDCPPLTAQLKNSADIRMVMDVRDFLNHPTHFNEFIILSGDADFTPVLQRLRAHARNTVIYANDHTAIPYTAISDGEVRESDLLTLLMEGRLPGESGLDSAGQIEAARSDILADVVTAVRSANQPLPLEALADRAVRALGHAKTVGTSWGGSGSFRELLLRYLPEDVRLSEQPPYYVLDLSRQLASPVAQPEPRIEQRAAPRPAPLETLRAETSVPERRPAPQVSEVPPAYEPPPQAALKAPPSAKIGPTAREIEPQAAVAPPAAAARPAPPPASTGNQPPGPAPRPALPQPPRAGEGAAAIQQSIARIHEASQAPPLSPPDYRVLFEVMAQEINTNGLTGAQTLAAIAQRGQEHGADLRRDDIRFVLEVVSEADPWFEQGASARLFASRFRNFVVARCRSQGLSLSADELDLIEAWFAGAPQAQPQRAAPPQSHARPAPQSAPAVPPAAAPAQPAYAPSAAAGPAQLPPDGGRLDKWWSGEQAPGHYMGSQEQVAGQPDDEFPRIVRTRLRG